MPKSPNRCIFCGAKPLTREHIWADWLRDYIPKKLPHHTKFAPIIDGPGRVRGAREKKSGDPHSMRVKCVCTGCNTGWMGDLQEAVKPIVIPLIEGDNCTLDSYQQQLLSAWSTMAIMAAEFDTPDRVTASEADRQWLMGHRSPPPTRWKIWIGNYKRGKWPGYFVHNAFSFTEAENFKQMPDGSAGPPNTQATTYVVGQLYIHLISSAYPVIAEKWRFDSRFADHLHTIWPNGGVIAWPPANTMTDRDADHIAGVFGYWFDRNFAPES